MHHQDLLPLFIILKIIIFTQFILVLIKKESSTNPIYIFSEALFQFIIAAFLLIFFNTHNTGLDFTTLIAVDIAAGLLLYTVKYKLIYTMITNYYNSLIKKLEPKFKYS
jgi:hypothetical protein